MRAAAMISALAVRLPTVRLARIKAALVVSGIGAIVALASANADFSQAAPPAAGLAMAERLTIDKSDRTLTIHFANGIVRTLHDVRFGPNWMNGPKRQRGDRKTPEGEYRVLEHRTSRDDFPDVTYLPALYLDYPNAQDAEASAAQGLDPGDAIMIHGPHPYVPEAVLRLRGDWTDGCAALTAAQMDYLMTVTAEGTPVTIQA